MQPRGGLVGSVLLECPAAVDRRPVPNHEQRARDLRPQLAQEGDHARAVEGLFLWVQEQTTPGTR